ncbi:MAG: bifunctional phosphoribosyl-AMP cyclohydrolase/phosphoribosyl-ATP diphosphatase HisIE [Syntrophomonadaceae bacterium]|nr:bifunctional phosphoribosyl-AMP cyclohydrolase/phosphoribosyl-ATP diphosphatase HisIE [Syntrophomonadaceae bacterium]
MLDTLKFDKDGLIPAVIQDVNTGAVLMLAWMNAESLMRTMESGRTCFYSRSRQELWSKGETSGHVQRVKDIRYDCDADAVLIRVEQTGAACHSGHYSCFYRDQNGQEVEAAIVDTDPAYEGKAGPGILYELMDVIKERKAKRPEGSYTTYLFDKGIDKILKKVGEESAEVIIAAKNHIPAEITYETADLFYHLLVLLAQEEVELDAVFAELKSRR